MATIDEIRAVLRDALRLGERVNTFDASTALFGSLPELDSMAVIAVIAAIEDRFGFTVDDDDVNAETFATVGSLCSFVEGKLGD